MVSGREVVELTRGQDGVGLRDGDEAGLDEVTHLYEQSAEILNRDKAAGQTVEVLPRD